MPILPLPTDPKKIRARIRRYERKLKQEKQQQGGYYGDGAGKRYYMAPLYMLMGDQDGAIESFRWYEQEFPNDIGDPGHFLCWTLALYRNDELEAARQKLCRTMLANVYVFPYLFGDDIVPDEIWGQWTEGSTERLYEIPWDYFELWSDAEEQWARDCWNSEDVTRVRERHIEINRILETEPRGPRRTQLVQEDSELARTGLESLR